MKKYGGFPNRRRSCSLIVIVLALLSIPAHGSMLTVPITGFVSRIPTITVTITDAMGMPQNFVGLVDSGNGDGLGISDAGRTKLGLGLGADQGVNGATGTGTVKTTTTPNGQAGTIAGTVPLPPGQPGPPAPGSLPIPATGIVVPALGANQVLIGADFLDQFGKYEINKKLNTITFTKPDQVVAVGLAVPMQSSAHCAFEPVPTSQCFSINAQLSSASNSFSSPFVISTGSATSLMTSEVAIALGLNLSSLPTETIDTPLGPITIPEANIAFGLPPLLGTTTDTFGILSDSLDPNHVNILGADILDQFDTYALNITDGRFEETSVPEPKTLGLLAIGIAMFVGAWVISKLPSQIGIRSRPRSAKPAD
jgi:hypothetical protein